ncbi:fibronectin type III domain-containing protein, partial [bacterium]|nr:fibronectin type III domain-containing protein [bacterium]
MFSLYWKIGNVSHSKDFSTRRNIKKPVLFPQYQGNVGSFDLVSAYVGSREINPPSNLNIIKVEDSIPENSRNPLLNEIRWIGNVGLSTTQHFLLTDVVGEYVSSEVKPFYWKHVLPDAGIDPLSVTILDSSLLPVDRYSYKVIRVEARDDLDLVVSGTYESCSIFSNYKNLYNKNSGETEFYYVRYSVSGTTHYKLLNSEPAFTEATTDDVSLVTGQLKSWRKVYILTTGVSYFAVTTPSTGINYYLTPLERSRILVKDPIDRSDNVPWFLSVSNGSLNIIRDSVPYSYSIPEFSSQTFSPLYPYKIEVEEEAERIKPDILKVDRNLLIVDSTLYVMDILICDANMNVQYALTSETTKNGTYYQENGKNVLRIIETDKAWVTWDSNGISSCDLDGGFIHLQREYSDTKYFYITYYYKETGYELTTLNVNPVFDEEYNGHFYVLYIIPSGGDNFPTQNTSIHYLKVDRSGRIIETSQNSSSGNLDLASTIHLESQYMYYSQEATTTSNGINYSGQNYVDVIDASSFPSKGILFWKTIFNTFVYKPYDSIVGNRIYLENTTLSSNLPALTNLRLHSFKTPYTTEATNRYQWLILAEVHSASSSRVDDLSIIDLRVPGGVIKSKYYREASALDPRSVWARPEVISSRGQAVPGHSAAIVKLPYTLLKDYGGVLALEEIEAIVKDRHLAVGVMPIIIFHGAIPEIESLSSTSTSISVSWYTEGSSYTYNIYYSTSKDGEWILANSSPVGDSAYGNNYTIEGLTPKLTYYVVVTSISLDGIESPKSSAWGIKTRNS